MTSGGTDENEVGLADAYALESPEDNVELYARWADSYEDGFMADLGYVYHVGVAEVFAAHANAEDGPVLDIGCGTGVVAHELARRGRWPFDGLDISPAMLAVAAEKLNAAGAPVYGSLIEADLTRRLEIASGTYGSIVSAGTFTTGHVGPEAIDELVRIVRPGGLLVLGVNNRFYFPAGFEAHLDGLAVQGLLTVEDRPEIQVYAGEGHEHSDDLATVIVARTTG